MTTSIHKMTAAVLMIRVRTRRRMEVKMTIRTLYMMMIQNKMKSMT